MNISFNNNNDTLAGTLTMPKGEVKCGLVLLHSSERSHRDEDYFKPLSEYLAGFGIATLRYDSPGSGESTGNAFLQSYIDRKEEAISAYNFLKSEIGNVRIGFSGLSEGASIAFMASKEIEESFVIPVSLNFSTFTVDSLLDDIKNDTNGDEREVFLCELWFDFYVLQSINRAKVKDFITKYGGGPWTALIDVLDKQLSPAKKYEMVLNCYKNQKDDYGSYQYFDYFINDVINHNLDLNGFVMNLDLWNEFVTFDVKSYIDNQKAFLIWGEEDEELDVPKEESISKDLLPVDTKRIIYPGLGHGLCNDEGYSIKMYEDIKDWILSL